MKYCRFCGSEMSDDAAFCTVCGKASSLPVVNSESKKGKSKLPIVAAILAGVSVVAVGCAILFLTGVFTVGSKESSKETIPMTEAQEQQPEKHPPEEQPPTDPSAASESPEDEEAAKADDGQSTPPNENEDMNEDSEESDGDSHLSKEEYRAICDEMYATDPVITKDREDLLSMCKPIIFGGIIDKEVYMNELSEEELCSIKTYTMSSCIYEQGKAYSFLKPKSLRGGRWRFSKKKLGELWSNWFDRDPAAPVHKLWEFDKETEDSLVCSFGDGEMVHYFKQDSAMIYENDSFYMVAGVLRWEEDEVDKYVCRILIRKHDWGLPGTIVYYTVKMQKAPIAKIMSSSTLPSSSGNSYGAKNLLDGNRRTAWAENKYGVGTGVSLNISLSKKHLVHGIAIMNGYHKSRGLYRKNGKVKSFILSTDGGDKETLKEMYVHDEFLGDGIGTYTYLQLKHPVTTDKFKLTIKSAIRGKKYNDTCISEMFVY